MHKKVGDTVKKGDLLADVETDKATMELESYKDGKLLYIGAEKGDKVPVNSLLCIIGDESKVDVKAIVAASKNIGSDSASAADKSSPSQNGAEQLDTEAKQETAVPTGQEGAPASGDDGRVKASPLAEN
jgi:pyruvate dehydrogenase E2 component (dihydrolipoamide acetyltransferase)